MQAMLLTDFLQTLLTEGSVTVQGQLVVFDDDDIEETKNMLHQYHLDDSLEMAYTPPPFLEEAAIWATQYFYKAVQLTVLREITEEKVVATLEPYTGKHSAEAIYSADLVLRYLPALFQLAKGLSPADILVTTLKQLASSWPFSSVGIHLDEPINQEGIFANASLAHTYIDRIIQCRDKRRVTNEHIEKLVYEVTGNHLDTFWPNYEPIQKLQIDAINIG